jgi:hypothetical protein
MTGKSKSTKRAIGYKPAFTREEMKLINNYDAEGLEDELWINRVVLLRTVDKMNEMKDQLSFRDHLEALRAVSYATGNIATLVQIHEEIAMPYQAVENKYREYFEEFNKLVEQLGPLVLGKKEWEDMQNEAVRQELMAAADAIH